MSSVVDATNHGFHFYYYGPDNKYNLEHFDGVNDFYAVGGGFASNTWLSAGAVVDVSNRWMFTPDGVKNSTSGTATQTFSINRVALGVQGSTAHAIAEFALWKGALADTDFVALQGGANPSTVQPGKLVCYLPMRNDVVDYGPNHNAVVGIGSWTAGTAVFTTHPPVAAPPSGTHLISSFTPGASRNDVTGAFGVYFVPVSDVNVTQIGVRCDTGATGLHNLSYWKTSGSPTWTVQIDLTGGTVGTFYYAPCPLTLLKAGVGVYFLAQQTAGDGQFWADAGSTTLTNSSVVYSGYTTNMSTLKLGNIGVQYVGVDLIYTLAPVSAVRPRITMVA